MKSDIRFVVNVYKDNEKTIYDIYKARITEDSDMGQVCEDIGEFLTEQRERISEEEEA